MKKRTLFTSIILLFTSLAFSQTNRSYNVKFLMTSSGDLIATNFILKVSGNEILYTKNGVTKNWDVKYEGEVTQNEQQGVSFKYYNYLLSQQNKNLYISTYKSIKHNGVFYYVLIIDGQKQLAL